MSSPNLVGVWNLLSFEIESTAGAVLSWGKNTHGLLIYTADGHMSVGINCDIVGDAQNAEHIFDAMLFYSGTYEVKGQTIIHHVKNASDVERIGQKMDREFTLQGDELRIVARVSEGSSKLVWKRI